MPRHTATLPTSTPSAGVIGGRSGVWDRELDPGTTITNSSAGPVSNSSADTMTAGRCLPGSPARAAPKATNHTSPRRGSLNVVGHRVCPVVLLVTDGAVCGFGTGGLALGAEDRLAVCFGG